MIRKSILTAGATLAILGIAWYPETKHPHDNNTVANAKHASVHAASPWAGVASPATRSGGNEKTKPHADAGAAGIQSGGPASAAKPALPRRPAYLDDLTADFMPAASSGDGMTGEPKDHPEQAPVELELGPGVRLPVAMLESETPLTAQEATARQNLVQFFCRELAASLAQYGPDITDERTAARIYARAQQRADAQYKVLFGDAAYNQAGMKAALEAIPAVGTTTGQVE